jgi:hypothetical protein
MKYIKKSNKVYKLENEINLLDKVESLEGVLIQLEKDRESKLNNINIKFDRLKQDTEDEIAELNALK